MMLLRVSDLGCVSLRESSAVNVDPNARVSILTAYLLFVRVHLAAPFILTLDSHVRSTVRVISLPGCSTSRAADVYTRTGESLPCLLGWVIPGHPMNYLMSLKAMPPTWDEKSLSVVEICSH